MLIWEWLRSARAAESAAEECPVWPDELAHGLIRCVLHVVWPGCRGELEYGLGMVCVLAGTGSTTLLATLYNTRAHTVHAVPTAWARSSH